MQVIVSVAKCPEEKNVHPIGIIKGIITLTAADILPDYSSSAPCMMF